MLSLINNKKSYENLTRKEAFNRAMEIINYKWSYNYKNTPSNIKLPYYLKEEKEYIGIPYCFGGRFSLDSSNVKDIKSFQHALENNYYPGNINTNNGYVKNTAGLDCSGFILSVFKIKENLSTTSLHKYFYEIDIEDIKPMDILNSKGKHVYVYLGKTLDNKGIIILESTSNGLNKYKDKSVVNYKSNNAFKKDIEKEGYIPMRYKKIKGNFKSSFDSYEYNNEERYSKDIPKNKEIKGSLDYLEDIDYYKIDLNEVSYIYVNRLSKNQFITIYNDEEEIVIDSEIKKEIKLKGDIYIKVNLNKSTLKDKNYSFTILNK